MAERLVEHRLSDIYLLGHSLAGEESIIAAPELNVCFDIGKAPAPVISIDYVLLSHGHMDHAAGVAYYFSQRNFVGNAPGTVVCPTALVGPLRDLVRVWGRIEGHPSPANIVGMEPGEQIEIRRGLAARSFAVNHGAPSLGFSVIDVRHKLKPEFADRTGPQLAQLKREGVEIQYTHEVPLVAYCGDTAEGAFLELDHVRKAKVLLLECTFFEEEHARRARQGYHMHVRDMARLLPRLENEWVVLTHVSRRTGLRHARHMLSRMVDPAVMERVKFLMEGKRPGRRPRGGDTEQDAPSK
jgi:ribonuclease Z